MAWMNGPVIANGVAETKKTIRPDLIDILYKYSTRASSPVLILFDFIFLFTKKKELVSLTCLVVCARLWKYGSKERHPF